MLWASGVRGRKGRVIEAVHLRHLRIITVEGVPFVFKTPMPAPARPQANGSAALKPTCPGVPCSHKNNLTGSRESCTLEDT